MDVLGQFAVHMYVLVTVMDLTRPLVPQVLQYVCSYLCSYVCRKSRPWTWHVPFFPSRGSVVRNRATVPWQRRRHCLLRRARAHVTQWVFIFIFLGIFLIFCFWQGRRAVVHGTVWHNVHTFSKVLCIGTLHRKYTGALTQCPCILPVQATVQSQGPSVFPV